MATTEEVRAALRNVLDPEINRPIEDIGMLQNIEVDSGTVRVSVLITIEGCPLKERIEEIAEIIGTTRETVSRLFSEFKKKQLLQLKGSTLVIRNCTALEKMVQS